MTLKESSLTVVESAIKLETSSGSDVGVDSSVVELTVTTVISLDVDVVVASGSVVEVVVSETLEVVVIGSDCVVVVWPGSGMVGPEGPGPVTGGVSDVDVVAVVVEVVVACAVVVVGAVVELVGATVVGAAADSASDGPSRDSPMVTET